MKYLVIGGALMAGVVTAPLAAQASIDSLEKSADHLEMDIGKRSLSAFSDSCTKYGANLEAITAAAKSDPQWRETNDFTVNARAFDIIPSMPRMYWYSKPKEVTVWVEEHQQPLVLIIATFGKNDDRSICAVIANNIKNAMPYFDDFDSIAKSAGLKRKSVDLPHYLQYSGKNIDGQYIRGDIYSRSQVIGKSKSMHLAFGFVTNIKKKKKK